MTNTRHPLGLAMAAAAFAATKHKNQRRKDASSSPYINHPLALANVLSNEGCVQDPVVICAALLHDTIEDTDTTQEELIRQFGPEIASVVMEVTDDKALPKAERKRLQVEHAAHISGCAKLVKLADKICNLRDILASPPADWSPERKKEYFNWAAQVVQQLRGTHARLEAVFDGVYARHLEFSEAAGLRQTPR
ncbi:HD domain-containing protein [Rhodoferax sp.]|uniref:HD domain-containing protein n=1 Tax=Rhodoferax sp. TaxID=50421 RepID=UPI0025FAD7DF|nr:HD domain-containing protein [Rhodoferax sp.]